MQNHTNNGKRQGRGLHLLLGCLLLVVFLRCEAQNLVANWSFEMPLDSCSWQIGFAPGSRPLHWYSWLNTPEHFNACAGEAGIGDSLVAVPQNGWTYQYPWDGDAYVGARVYDGGGNFREYVGTELIQPLVAGCTYQLRFRTNPAYGGSYWLQNAGTACDNVGMLFTMISNAWTGTSGPFFPFRNFAHLRTTLPVADTLNWTEVEGTFIADSAYSFLVLGNFFSDALTAAYPIGEIEPWTGITYYLFDGVEVIPFDECHTIGISENSSAPPMIRIIDDHILIQWDEEKFQVRLMDAVGRIIAESSTNAGKIEMSVPAFVGIYLVGLSSGNRSFVQKFIVP